MSKALISIANAKISANMDYRLSEAIINAYKAKNMKPITFKEMLDNLRTQKAGNTGLYHPQRRASNWAVKEQPALL